MKNLLLIALLFISVNTFAQKKRQSFSKPYTSADALHTAGKSLLAGYMLYVGGAAISGLGAATGDPDAALLGIPVMAVGTVFTILGYSSLAKAGKLAKLEQGSAYLSPAKNGIGLAFNF